MRFRPNTQTFLFRTTNLKTCFQVRSRRALRRMACCVSSVTAVLFNEKNLADATRVLLRGAQDVRDHVRDMPPQGGQSDARGREFHQLG